MAKKSNDIDNESENITLDRSITPLVGKIWRPAPRPIWRDGKITGLESTMRRVQVAVDPSTKGKTGVVVPVDYSIPKTLLSVTATESPSKQQDRTFSEVAISFLRDPSDTAFNSANVWFKNYKGNPNPVLMASASDSPIIFLCEATGETVTVYVQPVGTSGIAENLNISASTTVALDGVVSAPPAPSISQTLIAIPLGYQFAFNQVNVGSTEDVLDSYKVYRHTANNSAAASLLKTFKHDPVNNGAAIVVQDNVGGGTTYYYWVSAVNTVGLESTKTAAQSSATRPGINALRGGVSVVNTVTTVSTNLPGTPVTGPNAFSVPGWVQCQAYSSAGLIDIFIVGSGNAGYMFRLDTRAGQKLGQIFNIVDITAVGFAGSAQIDTSYLSNNAANLTGWFELDIYVGNNGYLALYINGSLVSEATDLNYTPTGVIKYGRELSNGKLGAGISQKAGSTFLSGQGSIANVSADTFSYSSTTTSVTWSWTAFTIYCPDGSTISVGTTGSPAAFTGLTLSTTYYFGMYATLNGDGTATAHVVKSDVSSGTAVQSLAQVVQVVNADGNVPIWVNRTAATPASGTGGGSGGGGSMSCFSPNTRVKTQRGDIPIVDVKPGEDYSPNARGTKRVVTAVTCRDYDGPALDMGNDELVTPEHLFLHEGKWVRVDSLGLYPVVHYKGTIHNLHIETETDDDGTQPDTGHSYTLANGHVAHNVET
jgi:hypothetical protein